jgi:hypothetical protein
MDCQVAGVPPQLLAHRHLKHAREYAERSSMRRVSFLILGLGVIWPVLAGPAPVRGLPVLFVEDRPAGSRFWARGSGLSASFTRGAVVYAAQGRSVRLRFPGANPRPRLEGADRVPGRVNFLVGAEQDWRIDLPVYNGMVYRDLYPGIDMRYAGDGRELKSEFLVAPGADPDLIRIRYEGAGRPRIGPDGSLLFRMGTAEVREKAPEAFQEVDGARVSVPVSFRVLRSGEVLFRLGSYDRKRPLLIDPVITYSTLLGGTGLDSVNAIAVDASGSAYVAGHTDAFDLPLTNPMQSGSAGGVEAFVAKLNASGNALVYCTYIGGSGEDRALGIALDASGGAYVAGRTQSRNFPVKNAYQSRLGGTRNAFVLRLNSIGNGLVFSTFLGGAASDSGNAIAVDSAGGVYVAGETNSSNFPATGYQRTNRGSIDGFVAKFTGAGQFVYSTLLGGYADDRVAAIAVNASGNASVTGSTWSSDFPVTGGQTTLGGGQDAFVARLNSTGTSLLMSRFLGGSGGRVGQPEEGRGIALDSSGYAYVAGVTASGDFPLQTASQTTLRGSSDAFVAKVSSTGALAFSTFLGGSGMDSAGAIAVAAGGGAYVAGGTYSADLPVKNAVQSTPAGDYDAFLARLDSTGSLTYLSYYGGSGSDAALGIALDAAGDVYIGGQTFSTNLPLVNAFQSANLGNASGFVAKFKFTSAPSADSITPASASGSAQVFRAAVSDEHGASAITSVSLLVQSGTSTTNACAVVYTVATNALSLLTDSGGTSSSVLTPGGSGTVENSQCVLSASGSAVSLSGAALTLDLSLSFKTGFAGSRNVYLAAVSPYGSSGWQLLATYTVTRPTSPPTVNSVSPASGSGTSRVFTLSLSDSAGYTDIKQAYLLVASSLNGTSACYIGYVRATNTLWLADDGGSNFQGPVTVGTSGTLQNTQCTLKAASSTATGSGTDLTLAFSVDFTSAFAGNKNLYGYALDIDNYDSGWQLRGAWTVPSTAVNQPPSVVSVSPSSGSGSSQTFAFAFSDPNGASDLYKFEAYIGSNDRAKGYCYVYAFFQTGQIWLLSDTNNWLGPVVIGSSGVVQNSWCSLDAAASASSSSGTNRTVSLALTFKAAFAGSVNISSNVDDTATYSGWKSLGTWTVTATQQTNQAPAAVSSTPSSGSGTSQTFAFAFSDANGQADIIEGAVLIGPRLYGLGSCYLYFSRSGAAVYLYLLNDAASSWFGPVVAGGSGTVQNSQCSIDASGTSGVASGNGYTLTVPFTFKSSYAGDLGIWLTVNDAAKLTSDWVQRGTWNVPTAVANQAPSFVSVTPSSGSGSSLAFTMLLTDANGNADIAQAEFLVGAQLSAAGSCYMYFNRSANSIWLLGDAGSWLGPLTLGTSSSAQNNQCVFNASGSSAVASGNNLSLSLSLGFKTGFGGQKGLYGTVTDNSGLSSGWQQRGNWTVP